MSAELYLYDAIGETGTRAEHFIAELNNIDSNEVQVHINSPGGNVFEGQAIAHALQRHPAKVITHVDGIAASIASLIALAGDEVHIAEGAFFMIHEPWSMVIGSANDMRKESEVLDKISNSLASTYAKRTDKSIDEMQALMRDETWLTAKEAIEIGFANQITATKTQAAQFDLSHYNHVPELLQTNLSNNYIAALQGVITGLQEWIKVMRNDRSLSGCHKTSEKNYC